MGSNVPGFIFTLFRHVLRIVFYRLAKNHFLKKNQIIKTQKNIFLRKLGF